MLNSQSLHKSFGLMTALLAICSFVAHGQSTIINTPSTDVETAQKTYVEVDFIDHLTSFAHGGFETFGTRVVYGVRTGLEVGANVFYTNANGATQPVELQPNAKWQLYQNEKHGIAIAVGGVLFLPLERHLGKDYLGLGYTTASKKVKGKYGPRFTGGFYHVVGSGTGSRAGGILGFEQPVHRRITVLADWYTGRNRLGYASAGFGAAISKKSVLYVCYNVGNTGRANNGLALFYGWTF